MANKRILSNDTAIFGLPYQENRKRLLELKSKLHGYPGLVELLGINIRYVWEYIEEGKIPTNKEAQAAMGIVNKNAVRKQKRRDALNKVANSLDISSWYRLESEVLKENVEIKSYKAE